VIEEDVMGGFVRTLTGDIAPSELGRTLVHEHLNVDWGEMLGRPNVFDVDRAEMADRMVAKMEDLADVGIGAMTECTPYGSGRYVDLYAEVAARCQVKIIASTGFFHESWCPLHPIAIALDLDELTDFITREITQGMGGTLIRAGLIKAATGQGAISPNEEKVLRAAARARLATGCPIITHLCSSMSMEQLDIFESEGLAPSDVLISHVGFEDDPVAEVDRLLDSGANISFDRIGMGIFFDDDHWIRLIEHARRRDGLGQVMLSHDAAVFAHGLEEASGDAVQDDFTYISRVFLPRLLAETDVTDGDIEQMLVTNPQRVLAFS
jgi:predicted metal-dependent phosphotriesterase family hydrolase